MMSTVTLKAWTVRSNTRQSFRAVCTVLVLTLFMLSSISLAGPREQARRMHDRLVGVPPSAAVIDSMAAKITVGDAVGAAMEAMQNPAFYNTTLREFATPWTNRDESVYADLNDSTATVIGMSRDDVPFDQVLYEDIVYVGAAAVTDAPYSQTNNDHYVQLQQDRVDLSDPANLFRQQQSALPNSPISTDQTAGIMTTRGFAEAYYIAGTNRSAVHFTTLNFMCMGMEDFRDVTTIPDRIRRDVTRSPGGDSNIYLNDCLGCHAGMDGLAGGLAFYNFDEDSQQLVYTDGVVQPNYNRGVAFRFGYETLGDSWINYWRSGPNSFVSWNGPGAGMGARSLGMEMAQNRQFSECQVQKTFEKVCYRTPNGAADNQAVQDIANSFEANNRSMKQVFAETASYCMGD